METKVIIIILKDILEVQRAEYAFHTSMARVETSNSTISMIYKERAYRNSRNGLGLENAIEKLKS